MDAIQLHKPDRFRRRFADKLSDSDTQRQAYREVEREYEEVFGERKYSSFESFIASYYRAQKK